MQAIAEKTYISVHLNIELVSIGLHDFDNDLGFSWLVLNFLIILPLVCAVKNEKTSKGNLHGTMALTAAKI